MTESGHHSGLGAADVWNAIVRLVDVWEKANCDCCGPNPGDEAMIDLEAEPAFAERVRHVGIELARAGDWAVRRARVVELPLNDDQMEDELCGRLLVGQGYDTYDPRCVLPVGHAGQCARRSA